MVTDYNIATAYQYDVTLASILNSVMYTVSDGIVCIEKCYNRFSKMTCAYLLYNS